MLEKLNKIVFPLLTAVLIILISYSIRAQENIISPADHLLQLSLLKPYKITYHVAVKNKEENRDFGLLIDQLKIIKINGKKYYERTQEMPGISLIDTSINNFSDLAPVYHSGHNLSGFMRLHFSKTRVTGEKYFTGKDSLFRINKKMPAPYFDSNMFEVVLSMLPLKKNFSAQIPYYEFESGGYVLYKAKIAGQEKIRNGKGSVINVWVLETTDGKSNSRFYIAKDTREILKKEVIRSPQVKILFERTD